MNQNDCIRMLESEYELQRRKNEDELAQRMAEIDRIDPEIDALRRKNASRNVARQGRARLAIRMEFV